MNVTVILEVRYSLAPDGSVWSQDGMACSFWQRYLEVFDRVIVVARAKKIEQIPEEWSLVTGENIEFRPLPDYLGPWQYLKQSSKLRAALRAAIPKDGAVILRVPSQIANVLASELRRQKRPYALELVGDPWEVFAPGAVSHPLRGFFRWYFSSRLRAQCQRAVSVAYVTGETLQRRYPTRGMGVGVSDIELGAEALSGDAFWTHYSSIELGEESISGSPISPRTRNKYRLVTVGSLAQLYKGTDILIEAVARCVSGGLDVQAVVVGDGKYRQTLMRQAQQAGMGSRIRFVGQVTAGEPVRRILDASDLFVLPSRTEGLPRAMIEAMARGLPCIGSAVGGIPELLEPGELVPPGDPVALAGKISEVLRNAPRRGAMSIRNLAKAMEYRNSVLSARRRLFYEYVYGRTERWQAGPTR
jgi:glycosyltransferase involved in cell wall biosynthesis